MNKPAASKQSTQDIVLFLKNVWFFIFFFGLLLLSPSLGIITKF